MQNYKYLWRLKYCVLDSLICNMFFSSTPHPPTNCFIHCPIPAPLPHYFIPLYTWLSLTIPLSSTHLPSPDLLQPLFLPFFSSHLLVGIFIFLACKPSHTTDLLQHLSSLHWPASAILPPLSTCVNYAIGISGKLRTRERVRAADLFSHWAYAHNLHMTFGAVLGVWTYTG